MEKEASKKGVVFQAVKDVVQSLVDDSMVHVDKIGTSNWYWAFPGEATAQLSNKLARLEHELKHATVEAMEMDERLDKAAADHPQTEERQMAEVMLASATEANAVRAPPSPGITTADSRVDSHFLRARSAIYPELPSLRQTRIHTMADLPNRVAPHNASSSGTEEGARVIPLR